MVSEQNKKSTSTTDQAEEGVLHGRRILVVDDEPDQQAFIAAILEDHGATVLRASDGTAAVELAMAERPDLITLDLAMPGMSGIDVFVALRQETCTKEIPVCIITGRPELRALVYEAPSGSRPEGYLNKPVTEKQLLLALRKIFEVRARTAERVLAQSPA